MLENIRSVRKCYLLSMFAFDFLLLNRNFISYSLTHPVVCQKLYSEGWFLGEIFDKNFHVSAGAHQLSLR